VITNFEFLESIGEQSACLERRDKVGSIPQFFETNRARKGRSITLIGWINTYRDQFIPFQSLDQLRRSGRVESILAGIGGVNPFHPNFRYRTKTLAHSTNRVFAGSDFDGQMNR
jgi:hypothetical protein